MNQRRMKFLAISYIHWVNWQVSEASETLGSIQSRNVNIYCIYIYVCVIVHMSPLTFRKEGGA